MILHCKGLIIIPMLIISGCIFRETSRIPEDQAEIIRRILRVNGYTIRDKDWVDTYLEFGSSSPHADTRDWYYLVLPVEGSNKLIITEDINLLDHSIYKGITTHAGRKSGTTGLKKWVDTIIIIGEEIIDIGGLNVFDNNFTSIPPEIKYLRGSGFAFSFNHITSLPEEIMHLTAPPVLYDSVKIYLERNKLDTCSVSDSIKQWLRMHEQHKEYWWQMQNPDTCAPLIDLVQKET